MLPTEVSHLFDQLIANELSAADLFCITLSLYEPDVAAEHIAAVIQLLEGSDNVSLQLAGAAAELQARYVDLFGALPDMVDNDKYSDKFLATTDDFFDDRDVDEIEARLGSVDIHEAKHSSYSHVAQAGGKNRDHSFANGSGNIENTNQLQPMGQPNHQKQQHLQQQHQQHQHQQHQQQQSKLQKKQKQQQNNKDRPVILWCRRDLRLFDNPALSYAAELGKPVIPAFLWSEEEEGPGAAGGATKVWLEQALAALASALGKRYWGARLILRDCRRSSSATEMLNLVKETNASDVVWTALYEPHLAERDRQLTVQLKKLGVTVNIQHSYLLHRPEQMSVAGVGAHGIGSVTHFMECCKVNAGDPIGKPIDPPASLCLPSTWPRSEALAALQLYKKPVSRATGQPVDWAREIRESWQFGEEGGYANLQRFLEEGLPHYQDESARADHQWTAVISPYLHWGELSPRTVLHEAFVGKIAAKFRRKLAWRDLSYWLFTLFPTMDRDPIRPPYAKQAWNTNKDDQKAWERGKTGYPLVDAAMRQLWRIGWMNNYMRHVVASFLISYMRQPWQVGYNWFQDTLLDADVAINAMMWQNGGMSGLDQWNFVMHPVDAAHTCDPRGDFVRQWVPELAQLPDKVIHRPWSAPPAVLKRAGVVLGVNYPERIVLDLEAARLQSINDVVAVRRTAGRGFIDPKYGRDMTGIRPRLLGLIQYKPEDLLLVPLITRKEFIYKTSKPDSEDNPYNAVLKGYVSRERDEEIARTNRVDFTASTLAEYRDRKAREDKINGIEDPEEKEQKRNHQRRTKKSDKFSKV